MFFELPKHIVEGSSRAYNFQLFMTTKKYEEAEETGKIL